MEMFAETKRWHMVVQTAQRASMTGLSVQGYVRIDDSVFIRIHLYIDDSVHILMGECLRKFKNNKDLTFVIV